MARNPLKEHKRSRRNNHVRVVQYQEAAQREILERKWYGTIEFMPELVHLAVPTEAETSPFHRWLPYRQGFSPRLVEKFLSDSEMGAGPVLDPFSGSGTTVVESTRLGKPALGLEVEPCLQFIANLKLGLYGNGSDEPLLPVVAGEFPDLYSSVHTPYQRGTLLLAAGRTVKGDGRPRKNLPEISDLIRETEKMVREDAVISRTSPGVVISGSALSMPFADASVGGILTSPPYLPRYDYSRVTKPMSSLFALESEQTGSKKKHQMAAHPRAGAREWRGEIHPAVQEVCDRLKEMEFRKSAGMIRSYFDEMTTVVRECARVIEPGAPMTWVIAGAMVDDVYVPSDLILASLCQQEGFEVEEIIQVRTFGGLRKLGKLRDIAPREVILSLRRAGRLVRPCEESPAGE